MLSDLQHHFAIAVREVMTGTACRGSCFARPADLADTAVLAQTLTDGAQPLADTSGNRLFMLGCSSLLQEIDRLEA